MVLHLARPNAKMAALAADCLFDIFLQGSGCRLMALAEEYGALDWLQSEIFSVFNEFMIMMMCVRLDLPDRTARLFSVRGLLRRLPPANHAVLNYIITHLHRSVYDHYHFLFLFLCLPSTK